MPKFSLLLELSLSSLLEGLVLFGWVVEDNGVENELVVFVVDVVCDVDDGRSLIQIVPETKWYPCGHVPPGSGRSTIDTFVPVLLVCCDNCDNGGGAGAGEYDCCA